MAPKKFPLHTLLLRSVSSAASEERLKPREFIAIGSCLLMALLKASDLPGDFWETAPMVLSEGLTDERARRALVLLIRHVVSGFDPEDITADHALLARLDEIALFFDPTGQIRMSPPGFDFS